jgi:hypothetical protein
MALDRQKGDRRGADRDESDRAAEAECGGMDHRQPLPRQPRRSRVRSRFGSSALRLSVFAAIGPRLQLDRWRRSPSS